MSEREREAAERLREEAEIVREEHEELRQVAEGGPPEEIEQGRVEAEEGRQAAETVRIEAESVRVVAETKRGSVQKTYLKVAGIVAFPLAFVALIPSVIGLVFMDRARTANCREIQELKAGERQEALDAYRNLNRTLRILKLERTEEIEAVARERRDATLERFKAREC